MIYYTIFVVLLLLGFTDLLILHPKKHIKKIYFIMILFLMCFAGMRYRLGTDYFTYYRIFSSLQMGISSAVNYDIEIFFKLLFSYVSHFWVCLFITAIIGISIKGKVIKKYSDGLFIPLFLYFCLYFIVYDMGIIRQSIAIAISMYSIKYIEQKRIIPYLICIGLGFCFHMSILIFLPAYWISRIKFKRSQIYILTVLSLGIGMLPVAKIVTTFLVIFPYNSLQNKYLKYIENNAWKPTDLLRTFILFVFMYFLYRQSRFNDNTKILLNLYAVGVWIFNAFISIHYISGRGVAYYLVVEIFLWERLVKNEKSVANKVVMYLLLVCYAFYYFHLRLYQFSETDAWNAPYIPYRITNFLE